MIGTGIFILPGTMAQATGSITVVLVVWILAGILALFGALTYAELGAALPEAGGDYAYLRRGFGERWAYLFGWTNSVLSRPCSAATIAAGLLTFVSFLLPAIAVPLVTWRISLPFQQSPYEFVLTPAQLYSAGVLCLLAFINGLGVRLGGQVQVALTAAKVTVIIGVIVLGFSLGAYAGPWGSTRAATAGGFLTALVGALWAYEGWSNLSLVGSEIVNPQKNIPRALFRGVVLVALLYILLNVVCFVVLPFDQVAASSTVVSDVVRVLIGGRAATWLTVAMILSALGTLNSSTLTGARVPYAMARDNRFFRVAGRVHPQFHTPTGALVLQAVIASVLALTGTFEDLYSLFIFSQWIFYGLTAASLFALRRSEPGLPRPYRTWGYPVVPALFVLACGALTVNLWALRPIRSSLGLAFMLLGLTLYGRWARDPGSEPSREIT